MTPIKNSSIFGFDLIMLIIMFVLIMILIIFTLNATPESPTAKKFAMITSGISTITLLLAAFVVLRKIKISKEEKQNKNSRITIENQEKSWTFPFREMLKEYPESLPLLKSLSNDSLDDIQIPKDIDVNKMKLVNYTWSQYFIQIIENFLSSTNFDNANETTWINIFIQWISSNIIRNYWNKNYMNYDEKTRKFIDKLVKTSTKFINMKLKLQRQLTDEEWKNLSKDVNYN